MKTPFRVAFSLLACLALASPSRAGKLYVAMSDNSIVTYDVSGSNAATIEASRQVWLPATAGLSDPRGITFDGQGNLFVSNGADNTIKKVTPAGVVSTAYSTNISNPAGLAFGPTGSLYVANAGNGGSITQFSPGGGISSIYTGFESGGGVAVDSAGNVYSGGSNWNNNWRVYKNGQEWVATEWNRGMSMGPADNLFVATLGNDVYKITPAGSRSTFATQWPGRTAVFADSLGRVYHNIGAWNQYSESIVRYRPDGSIDVQWYMPAGAQTRSFTSFASTPVPEIDPAGMGSVVALFGGALGLLERRRSKNT
jgi:sugar lactone lactonase YvrE